VTLAETRRRADGAAHVGSNTEKRGCSCSTLAQFFSTLTLDGGGSEGTGRSDVSL